MTAVKDPYDRERDAVERDYDDGLIDGAEANRLLREIDYAERDDYAAARQEAHEQLDRDMGYGW